jgi:TatD DNase family protein
MEDDKVHLLDDALRTLQDKGIFTVATSIQLNMYLKSLEIADKSPYILPTFGLMGTNTYEFNPKLHLPAMESSPILGEFGLTNINQKAQFDDPKMEQVVEKFLEHAEKNQKIIIYHTSSADEEAIEKLDNYSLPGVVIHGFRASMKLLQKIIDKGYYISAGALITNIFQDKPDWNKWRTIASNIPLDLLLTETDGPVFKYSITSETVIKVVDALAELKHTNHQEIKERVFFNFKNLLHKDSRLKKYSEFLENV